jgi:hypothetical protein
MPVLAGRLIRLEPLALEHAPGYLTAAGTGEQAAEVFRWMSPPGGALAQPVTAEDATRHIADALAARPAAPGPPPPGARRPARSARPAAARRTPPGPQRPARSARPAAPAPLRPDRRG